MTELPGAPFAEEGTVMREQTFAVTLAVHGTLPAHSSEIASALEGTARVVRVVQVTDPDSTAQGVRRLLERNGVAEQVIAQVLAWVGPYPDDEPVDAAAWTPVPGEEKGND